VPLYEVVLDQRYYGNQCINRWNYMGSGTPAAVSMSFALLQSLGFIGLDVVLPTGSLGEKLQNMQNGAVIYVQATCRAIYIDEDFYGNPFLAGTTGRASGLGGTSGPTNAFGFRSNRVKQSIGRGYKRFVGMSDGDTDVGGILTAAAITNTNAVKTAMSEPVTYDDEGNTLTFTPCIAQKVKYTTPSGKDAYKYYPTEAAQAPHLAIGIAWEAYQQERTQTTRQYGRGS